MQYKIRKQYTVEVPIAEVVEVLKKGGALPADMKPEHDIHAGASIQVCALGSPKSQFLRVTWQETEEIGKDGLRKKDVAVKEAEKLRAGRKKKRSGRKG